MLESKSSALARGSTIASSTTLPAANKMREGTWYLQLLAVCTALTTAPSTSALLVYQTSHRSSDASHKIVNRPAHTHLSGWLTRVPLHHQSAYLSSFSSMLVHPGVKAVNAFFNLLLNKSAPTSHLQNLVLQEVAGTGICKVTSSGQSRLRM